MTGIPRYGTAPLNKAFAALSDSMRRRLVDLVLDHPGINVSEVCAKFSTSRFTVMRHLNVLEDARIIRRERDGRAKLLYVDRSTLSEIRTGWLKQACLRNNESGDDDE